MLVSNIVLCSLGPEVHNNNNKTTLSVLIILCIVLILQEHVVRKEITIAEFNILFPKCPLFGGSTVAT